MDGLTFPGLPVPCGRQEWKRQRERGTMTTKYRYTRHAIHIEGIGAGRAGLFLGPAGKTAEGPAGWARVRSDGAVQMSDGAPYEKLTRCPTTGALILPPDEEDYGAGSAP